MMRAASGAQTGRRGAYQRESEDHIAGGLSSLLKRVPALNVNRILEILYNWRMEHLRTQPESGEVADSSP
jgi:hypothetical protein